MTDLKLGISVKQIDRDADGIWSAGGVRGRILVGAGGTHCPVARMLAPTRPNRAVGHVKVGDKWEPRYLRNPDPQTPAAGVSSSANDMARWLTMLLANGTYNGQRITSPEALLPAITPQVISVPAGSPQARAAQSLVHSERIR